jgi:preprotein translocase subunit SecG
MSGRGAANLLTRITAVLAAAFFSTSILLAIMATSNRGPASILGGSGQTQSQPAGGGGSNLPPLKTLVPPSSPSGPQVPQSQ